MFLPFSFFFFFFDIFNSRLLSFPTPSVHFWFLDEQVFLSIFYSTWLLFSGLDVCEQFMDVNDMIKDEDLIVHKFHSHGSRLDRRFYTSPSVHNIQQLVSSMVPSVNFKRPSARELNLLKRKAKINSKDQAKGWSEDGDMEASNAHSVTTPKSSRTDPFGSSKVSIYVSKQSFFHV